MIANLSGTPSRLSQAAIGTTSTTLYTAQPDGRTAITDIAVVNTTTSTINLSVCVGSIAAANAMNFYSTPIPGSTSVQLSGYQILNRNEVLVAQASAAGLTISVSGVERV